MPSCRLYKGARSARALGLALGVAVATVGCQATKQQVGVAIGAVAGGVLGSRVGSGSGRVLATIAGGLAGAWIGSTIGARLDEADQERLARSTQEAAVTGEDQSWENPETGARGTVRVKETTRQTRTESVKVLKGRVETIPPITLDPAVYSVAKSANVRGGPGTNYVVVDGVTGGSEVDVLGQVQGSNWMLLSQNGAGAGFVHNSLLKRVADGTTAVAQASNEDIVEIQVATGQECRVITQDVTTTSGEQVSEDVTVCRGADGWQLV